MEHGAGNTSVQARLKTERFGTKFWTAIYGMCYCRVGITITRKQTHTHTHTYTHTHTNSVVRTETNPSTFSNLTLCRWSLAWFALLVTEDRKIEEKHKNKRE